MSSFFTIPASQRKRKREDRLAAPGSKKRGIAANGETRENSSRQRQDRDESISGSDIEEDEDVASESGLSDDATTSDSDEGETAAERRLKLAERYLENVREEVVDEAGFDAAEIDRDLIAERLKEDVVRSVYLLTSFFFLGSGLTSSSTG
jgi:ribosomal RNA-processing protein 9